MEGSDTKVSRYKSTAAEEKPLGVLINPDNLDRPAQELCSPMKIGRTKHYDAMGKDGFIDLASETAMDLTKGKAPDVFDATYKYVLIREGYQGKRIILAIAGTCADKQKLRHPGGVDIQKQYEKMSDEELEELVK